MRASPGLLLASALGMLSYAQTQSTPAADMAATSTPADTTASTTPTFASKAGPEAKAMCEALVHYQPTNGLKINNTFAEYYPEGSMPSLEQLAATYPTGTIPPGTDVPSILDTVGPDIDIKSDAGYGKANSRASKHGPLGSMPAFCRFGAFVSTSEVTTVFSEVWLPLKSDPTIPLAPVNGTDTTTNSTAFLLKLGGGFDRVPLFVELGQVVKYHAAPGSTGQPNDVPAPVSAKADQDKKATTGGKGAKRGLAAYDEGMQLLQRRKEAASDTCVLDGDEVIDEGDGWNGRLAVIGNGAQRGFVPLADLKQMLSRYNFAVAGSNAGHFSGGTAVTWVNGTQFDATLLDFGSRATHVTMQLAEGIIDTFYGATTGKRMVDDNNRVTRYFLGSSVGAARGLASAQVDPDDFHGIVIGPPANQFMSMNTGQLHTASVHNKTTAKDGVFTRNALYGPMKDVITRQCDKLDGVEDSIISNPFDCKPNYQEMLCGTDTKYGKSNGTCLTQVQIDNAYNLYKPTIIDGQQVYPAYLPGLEDSASSMNAKNDKASGWHQLVVLRHPKLNSSFNPFTDIRYSDLQQGIAADPGGVNAAKTDLSAFFNKKVAGGGKMMMYHGSYDLVVSPQATIDYYENVLRDTPGADKSFKFFFVPGMRHSRGGPGAWSFGGPTQGDPGNRPLAYDTQHDIILATMAWVEQAVEPKTIVAARYTQREDVIPERAPGGPPKPATDLPIPDTRQNYNWGLTYTRLLCPWPTTAKYTGGSAKGKDGYKAFVCA